MFDITVWDMHQHYPGSFYGRIDCMARVTDGFKVRVGLHQGCIRENGSCV